MEQLKTKLVFFLIMGPLIGFYAWKVWLHYTREKVVYHRDDYRYVDSGCALNGDGSKVECSLQTGWPGAWNRFSGIHY